MAFREHRPVRPAEPGSVPPRPGELEAYLTVDARLACVRARSSPDGLSSDDAAARLRSAGPNRLPEPQGPAPLRELLGQFIHFFALMLWAAAALAFVGKMPQLGVAIIAVVVVNGIFAFVQEFRADRAARALGALLPPRALVVRDGRKAVVGAEDVVPGDVLVLSEGDRICADGRVISCEGLKVDLSMLTGESEPVARSDEPASGPGDPANAVFAGTYVTAGSGRALVIGTGARTQLGGISRLTAGVVRRPTPLRLDLDRAVRFIAAFAVVAGVAFFGVSLGLGMPVRDGFLFAVGVIVALVPEGLLPTLTLSLAMSAKRMAGKRALVRRLESIETLGATTVICSDKTGTITANQMTVQAIAVGETEFSVTGSGYELAGTILSERRPLTADEQAMVKPLLRAGALCGDARIESDHGRVRCVGDPTEGALLVVASKGGVERRDEERLAPRVREFPFESVRMRMSTVHVLPSGAYELLIKGSPEALLDDCTSMRMDHGVAPLDEAARARASAMIDRLAGKGLRLLALARRELPEVPRVAAEAEHDLELLGIVGMHDPVRPEVPEAVARCLRAGIRIVMVTGDHPGTAREVARTAGLLEYDILLGSELPEADEDLADLLDRPLAVIARVAPEQKLRIARALQARGHVVAMTGDGVNDAPALRQADIGVAMGRSGTDVARGAADIILLDDNFAHIVEAVEEGRAAFDNIRRFLTYHLTDNVAELAPFAVWALSGGRIPLVLTVLQILALDIGTDLLPALALGGEPPEKGTMRRPPRSRRARLMDGHVLGRAFGFLGPVEAIVSMSMVPLGAALFFGWHLGDPLPSSGVALATLSTMVFASIVVMQMANALECRSTPASLLSIGPLSNTLLDGAIVAEAIALIGFVYFGPIRRALDMNAISIAEWIPIVCTPWILIVAEELRKAYVRRRAARPAGEGRRGSEASRPAGDRAGPSLRRSA
ncbi:MAG: cation-translocating P-type ATPase [Actinomycetota bacterium]